MWMLFSVQPRILHRCPVSAPRARASGSIGSLRTLDWKYTNTYYTGTAVLGVVLRKLGYSKLMLPVFSGCLVQLHSGFLFRIIYPDLFRISSAF